MNNLTVFKVPKSILKQHPPTTAKDNKKVKLNVDLEGLTYTGLDEPPEPQA